MLRITHVESTPGGPMIRLEGKLVGPWADEVRAACDLAAVGRRQPRLDLSAVTYVDQDGALLLEELLAGGAELTNCSRFVAALLHREAQK